MSNRPISVEQILYVQSPEELFGELDGTTPLAKLEDLERRYEQYALVIPPKDTIALEHLQRQYEAFRSKLESEASTPLLPGGTDSHSPDLVTYESRRIASGDLADVFVVTKTDDYPRIVQKIARDSADCDLLQHEADVLTTLQDRMVLQGDKKFAGFMRYLPQFLKTFHLYRDGTSFHVNCFEYLHDFYSLEQVHAAYPDGVEFQDAVWMFNRLLECLGFVHRQTIIHGAVLPSHMMIRPKDHAAKLIDWTASVVDPVKNLTHISVASNTYEDFYPVEVLERLIPTPATDIYMAAKCMVYILGGDTTTNAMPDAVPDYLQHFFRSCLLTNPHQRPKDAWQLRDEFADHMRRHYGPPAYHKFIMPNEPTS